MKFLRLYAVSRLRAQEWYVPGTYVHINAETILAMNDVSLSMGGARRPVCCITVGATNEDDVTFYVAHESREIMAALNATSIAVAITQGVHIGMPSE